MRNKWPLFAPGTMKHSSQDIQFQFDESCNKTKNTFSLEEKFINQINYKFDEYAYYNSDNIDPREYSKLASSIELEMRKRLKITNSDNQITSLFGKSTNLGSDLLISRSFSSNSHSSFPHIYSSRSIHEKSFEKSTKGIEMILEEPTPNILSIKTSLSKLLIKFRKNKK